MTPEMMSLSWPVPSEPRTRDRHHANAGIADARDTDAVVGRGGDDARHPGAVTVGVGTAVGAVEHRRAGHELPGEIRMRCVDAGVEHGDGRAAKGEDAVVNLVPADAGSDHWFPYSGSVGSAWTSRT